MCVKTEPFTLITKTQVKADYMLNDHDIAALPFTTKEVKAAGGSFPRVMHLYMRCQVVTVAITKHGSLEVLAVHRQESDIAKLNRSVDALNKKRKTESAALERERQRPAQVARLLQTIAASTHVHTYDRTKATTDPDTGMQRNSCLTCSYVDEYEDI
jgi:hypothetical protein